MGLSINDSVYSCVFFFLTGLHFFHLVVGLLLLSLLSWSCSFSFVSFIYLIPDHSLWRLIIMHLIYLSTVCPWPEADEGVIQCWDRQAGVSKVFVPGGYIPTFDGLLWFTYLSGIQSLASRFSQETTGGGSQRLPRVAHKGFIICDSWCVSGRLSVVGLI